MAIRAYSLLSTSIRLKCEFILFGIAHKIDKFAYCAKGRG